MPHTALAASRNFEGRSKRGLYGDTVEELDFHVGRILDALEKLGLAGNTYVLFASDNGPWLLRRERGGSAHPLRSGKVSCWEGGFRVPGIFWAPGRIPAGQVSGEMMATLDILPTFAALAGAALPGDRAIDGLDQRDLIAGRSKGRRDVFYYYLWTHLQAVRSGDWKLHLPRPYRPEWLQPLVNGNHIDPADEQEIPAPMLFHLGEDVGERRDVAARNPEVVKRLVALAEEARQDVGDYNRTGRNARFFDPMEKRPSEPVRKG
jgi:arylsulfatase